MADRIIRPVEQISEDDDKLKRCEFIELLERIIKNIEGPFVINLNGDWGSGKSFTLMLLKKKIEETIGTIYINTSENDYYDEPFIVISGEIIKNVIKKQNNDGMQKKVLKEFLKFSKTFMTNVTPIIINTGMSFIFGKKAASKLAEVFAQSLGEYSVELIKKFESKQADMNALKEILEDYINTLESKKLIILIDELDRCRSEWAIEILELLKHLFNIRGLIFIVATATERLIKSVENSYGITDGYLYLRKYFNMTIDLPEVSTEGYIKWRLRQYQDLLESRIKNNKQREIVEDEIIALSMDSGLKIRNLEECLNGFIIWTLSQENYIEYPFYILAYYMNVINSKNFSFLEKFKKNGDVVYNRRETYYPSSSTKIKTLMVMLATYAYKDFHQFSKEIGGTIINQVVIDLLVAIVGKSAERVELLHSLANVKIEKFINNYNTK